MKTKERLAYLERDLAVWKGRQERALQLGSKELIALYTDHDFNIALGEMCGEIHRLRAQLGLHGNKPLRRKGTRRVNPNKEN